MSKTKTLSSVINTASILKTTPQNYSYLVPRWCMFSVPNLTNYNIQLCPAIFLNHDLDESHCDQILNMKYTSFGLKSYHWVFWSFYIYICNTNLYMCVCLPTTVLKICNEGRNETPSQEQTLSQWPPVPQPYIACNENFNFQLQRIFLLGHSWAYSYWLTERIILFVQVK